MVCEWGMSEKLGPLTFGQKEEQIFLGREIARHRDYSEKTAELIDQEVRGIVETEYDRAVALLEKNRETLVRIAETLLEWEVLDGEEISKLVRGEPLDPLPRKRRSREEKGQDRSDADPEGGSPVAGEGRPASESPVSPGPPTSPASPPS
jgi:cell division protease FtsH